MKRTAGSSRRARDHCLPGTPAADEMCLQSTEDAGSPPETEKGPTDPPPLCPPPLGWGVFHLRPYSLVEGQSSQVKGQGSNTHRAGSPGTSGHRALGCHPRGSGGPGSQQGSPRGQIWMSAPSPPTETFLSKHRPGSQPGRAAPIPADRWERGPDRACHCPSVLRPQAVATGRRPARPTWAQPFGIPEPSSLLTVVMTNLGVFLY